MQVTVPHPDVKGRTEILNWYLSKIKVDPGRSQCQRSSNIKVRLRECTVVCCWELQRRTFCCHAAVDAEIIARGTVGFSGAELENLVNQAALKAAVDEKEMVTMKDLEFAKDKILMGERTQKPSQIPSVSVTNNPFYSLPLTQGPERRSVEIDKKNKTITAYHESGHAIVAYFTKDAMPINKATIMPRGPTLGHVRLFLVLRSVSSVFFPTFERKLTALFWSPCRRCPCCQRTTDGVRPELSCWPRWTSAWGAA